jgi:hypothetical protein
VSGCCGQGPVIISGTPGTAGRLDVETVLLCDVLPDGTVAGVALVEPVYDATSGERIATRTVDPVTGAVYVPSGTLGPCSPDGCNATTTAQVLCDVQTDGTAVQFNRATTYDCQGALLATLDRTLDGAAYTVTGTVQVCPTAPDCELPTTPTATVGLCLPDGTPIAVTVVRDCEGVVTQEGWVNLRTGAFSAGAPPAGTIACGDGQSVQVSGTFCDLAPDGAVLGLVLIEYSYAEDGTISGVRLVDATTGATYTPQGTISVCPAGVEQPEQDLVQLCDVQPDGTVVAFVRDFRRDEVGAVTAHSDYTLDGAAYVPTGTVGSCQPADVEVELLCFGPPSAGPTTPFLRHYRTGPGGTVTTVDTTLAGDPLTIPAGETPGRCYDVDSEYWPLCVLDADGNVVRHVMALRRTRTDIGGHLDTTVINPVTGAEDTLDAGESYAVCPSTECADSEVVVLCDVDAAGASTPFLRHLTYDCDGAATATTDTALDGATPYTVTGTVGVCDPATPAGVDVETIPLCLIDNATGDVLEHMRAELVYDADGARIETRYVDAVTGAPVTVPAGARLDVCPAPDGCARQILERCGCDITATGEVVPYTELWAVDPCNGEVPVLLGAYRDGDLTQPYTPVNPGECPASLPDEPEPLFTGVRRLAGDEVVTLSGLHPGLQSATLTVLAGQGTVTTDDGTETIPAGVTLTWSVSKDSDQALTTWTGGSTGAGSDVLLHFTYRG